LDLLKNFKEREIQESFQQRNEETGTEDKFEYTLFEISKKL